MADPVREIPATATFAARATQIRRPAVISASARSRARRRAGGRPAPARRPPLLGIESGAFGAVKRTTAHHDHLETAHVELLSAVPAACDASWIAGRHEALAAGSCATKTVFLPAALAR